MAQKKLANWLAIEGLELVKELAEQKKLDKAKWKRLKNSYVSKTEKPTQNWSDYDRAKTNEASFFCRCLRELLIAYFSLDEFKVKNVRNGYSFADKIFAICIKCYYRSDLRKGQSILKQLKGLNLIDKVPCYKSIDNFFNEEKFNKILDELILISALPLAFLEDTGAIDATGLSISRFDRWFEEKWGKKKKKKKKIWRKLHIVSGCKSNAVLTAELTKDRVADVTMTEHLVKDKIKYFKLENFVADMAYSSKKVLAFLDTQGLKTYIPFKRGTTGNRTKNTIWKQSFVHFLTNHQEFMRKYHQRSNVETSIHMLKQRFGDHLLTKNFIANINEIKARILCHNICCLATEVAEFGFDIDFFDCVSKIKSV